MRKRFHEHPIPRCRQTRAREQRTRRGRNLFLSGGDRPSPMVWHHGAGGPGSDAIRTQRESRSMNGQPPDRVTGQPPRQRDRPGISRRPV
jgi:hypothetical protein